LGGCGEVKGIALELDSFALVHQPAAPVYQRGSVAQRPQDAVQMVFVFPPIVIVQQSDHFAVGSLEACVSGFDLPLTGVEKGSDARILQRLGRFYPLSLSIVSYQCFPLDVALQL